MSYSYAMTSFDFSVSDLSSPAAIRQVQELVGLPKTVQTLVMIKSQAIVREFDAVMAVPLDHTSVGHPTDAAYADYVAAVEFINAFRQQWTSLNDWESYKIYPASQDTMYDVTALCAQRDAWNAARQAARQRRRDRFAALMALAILLRNAQMTTLLMKDDPTAKAAFDAI